MTGERIVEIRGLLLKLEKRLRQLEWDSSRNQINEYKKQELVKLKKEHEVLVNELKELEQPQVAV